MDLQPGDRFGRYELVSWLGRGGMAETWRARLVGDAGVTKPVLIKKVLPEYANDEAFISMFISEARICATLSHGNVAQVFDFGRVDGEYFLAMEFVDGQPLNRLLKRALKAGLTALPIPLAVYIAQEMCRGLHYAHTRTDSRGAPLGIVHRDISPDNVLIGYDGQVKIVDFGIAKARSLRTFKTEPGVVKGKYLFFSPEQAYGEEVDARTDVWATGVVLYELLCGQLPVKGPPPMVMARMSRGEFPSPRQVRKELPAALDEIVMRALSVDLDMRYESSQAFADALGGFLHAFAPRFSSMNLAYLVRELFRGELAQEDRELPVPASFQEELSAWRSTAPVLPPVTARGRQELPVPATGAGTARQPRHQAEPMLEPDDASRGSRGPLVMGVGLILTVASVFLAIHLATRIHELPEYRPPPPPAPAARPAATAPRPAAPAATPDAGTAGTAPASAPRVEAGGSAVYPVSSIQLDARRDVLRVSSNLVAYSRLDAGDGYTVSDSFYEEKEDAPNTAILEPAYTKTAPAFFLAMGRDLPADEALGRVGQVGVKLRLMTAIAFFTPGPRELNQGRPGRMISLMSHTGRQSRRYGFYPDSSSVSVDSAFLLQGLELTATYKLTAVRVADGAFVHGRQRGPVRRVLCVQSLQPGEAAWLAHWRVSFMLEEGKSVQVRGIQALRCGFVDDENTSDNEGGMEIQVKQTARAEPGTVGPRSPDGLGRAAFDRLKQGDLETSLQLAQQGLKLDPDHPECLLWAGASLDRLGRFREAATHYRRFISLYPDHPRADTVRLFLSQHQAD